VSLGNSLFFAWQTITRQRLRSFLALLGITVGALAMVSVVSVEQSWRQQVERAFTGLDLNRFYVDTPQAGKGLERNYLIDEDAEAIRKQCPAVDKLTVYTYGDGSAHRGRQRVDWLIVWWMDRDFADVFGLGLVEGRFLTTGEADGGAQVCLITPELKKALFPEGKAIGEQLRLKGFPLRVAGVAAVKDDPNWSKSACIYVPRRLFRMINQAKPGTTIRGRAKDPEAGARQIDALMRQRVGGDETVEYVRGPWVAREAARNVRNRVQLIGVLAAICALLLGSYGVGAVLYVSVAESAREIGVRRALGASRAAAASEVMLAGLIFGAVGAAAGIALARFGLWLAAAPGVMIPQGFERTFEQLAGPGGPQGVPSFFLPTISWQPVAAAAISSLLMCLVASLEPASEVVRLDPAQAISRGLAPDRRLRLGLAMAQVTIAVAAIALLPSLYESLERADKREMRGAFRANAIDVFMWRPEGHTNVQYPPDWFRDAEMVRKTYADPQFPKKLLAACPLLSSAEPEIWLDAYPLSIKAGSRILWPVYGYNVLGCNVVFVNPSFYPTETGPWNTESPGLGEIKYGRFFTDEMVRRGERVCVLDTQSTVLAYDERNGVGQTVRINGVPFRVVGTMTGGNVSGYRRESFYGYNGRILVPLGLYDRLLPVLLSHANARMGGFGPMLHVRVKDESKTSQAAAQLQQALPKLMPAKLAKPMNIPESLPGGMKEYLALRAAAAKRSAFCAGALLLVALIGLANTLLISLGEQVREVGIRRALGAGKWQVMVPLLTEGLGLAGLGALLGVVFAGLLSWALRTGVMSQRFLFLSPFWALAAGLAMVLTSLLVSLIPGLLATRVNPATALRSE